MGTESRQRGGSRQTTVKVADSLTAPVPLGLGEEVDVMADSPSLKGCEAPEFEGTENSLVASCSTFSQTGVVLAWLQFGAPKQAYHIPYCKPFEVIHTGTERTRNALPLRLGILEKTLDDVCSLTLQDVISGNFSDSFALECWHLLSFMGVNTVHSGYGHLVSGPWRSSDRRAAESMQRRILSMQKSAEGVRVIGDWREVESELKSRKVNYTGEELLHCHKLSLEQILPALPPASHGGCVNAIEWVGPLTRHFLCNPREFVVPDTGQFLPKLQGKIHVVEGELDRICDELIGRNVCTWLPLEEVLHYRGEPVLNGLFGVEKAARTPSGRCVLRVIMNLVSTNAVVFQLSGGTASLPYVGQWLSTVIEGDQELRLWQSDMSAAFYLFSIPRPWWSMLAFNVLRKGYQIGRNDDKLHALVCKVIPMGFNSSVALMQELSERLLLHSAIPGTAPISRDKPVPHWLCDSLKESASTGRAWYHIYLDNFCAGAKVDPEENGRQGDWFHTQAEAIWKKAGVISSEKKRKSRVEKAEELGCFIDGAEGTMGVTTERLLRLCQATLYFVGKKFLNRKMAQILAGRWIHVLQFRRAGMSCLDEIWKYVGGNTRRRADLRVVRRELLTCMSLCPLLVTNLAAKVANFVTASDASSTGGAVAISRSLTTSGADFVRSSLLAESEVVQAPVLVISLFNGIGGALRAYDVLGIQVAAAIVCDTCKEANRITMRRWPFAELINDVHEIDLDLVKTWFLKYTHIREIHVWGGFPCRDLSSAKKGRLNLAGPESSLFFEIPRILDLLQQVFGRVVKIKKAFENVASMDQDAVQEISSYLALFPYFLDPVQAIPMHRPRLCWTSEDLTGLIPGVELKRKSLWTEVVADNPWPDDTQWVTPGWIWEGRSSSTPLPTAMRTIPKTKPPPFPAGINRCDWDTTARWEADEYRVAPYQYKMAHLMTNPSTGRWRRPNADEKEILLGYGAGHTLLARSASKIKQSKVQYEDERQSLLGDSFSIHSFAIIAAGLCREYVTVPNYSWICSRLGVAPGFCLPFSLTAPLSRLPLFGGLSGEPIEVHLLNRQLLARTNHTGSDVRITTGAVLNPKCYPRQAASANWWKWTQLFRTRWSASEHINLLELRSIFLALKHAVSHLQVTDYRLFHISDSYVCISIVAKGRTSSVQLNRVLRQFNAYLLAFGLQWIQCHVESTEDPTDEASRKA